MNKVIVEYSVISSITLMGLITNVNASIRDGFEPLGGVSVVMDSDDTSWYHQAVVQYETKEQK